MCDDDDGDDDGGTYAAAAADDGDDECYHDDSYINTITNRRQYNDCNVANDDVHAVKR